MKRIICIILSFALIGCGQKPTKSAFWEDNGKIKVLSTIGMIHDLVCRVGGERVDAISLITGEFDPHSYELVKGDDEKFTCADLIFYNGLGLEHGLSLRRLLESNPKAIALSDLVFHEKPGSNQEISADEEATSGATSNPIIISEKKVDPHIWMDISLWVQIINPIVEELSKLDPEHAHEFKERGDELCCEFIAFDQIAYNRLQAIPKERRYLVTCHSAFDYFARRYLATPEEIQTGEWRSRARAPEGLAPEAQIAFSDINNMVSHVKAHNIEVLFPESNVNRDSLEKIRSVAEEMGFSVRLAGAGLYADSMGTDEKGSHSYIAMMMKNVEIIVKELDPK